MKLHDLLQTSSRFVRTHKVAFTIMGACLLVVLGFLVKTTDSEAEQALNTKLATAAPVSSSSNPVEAASYTVELPTSTATAVETLPDPVAAAITSYPVGKMFSDQIGNTSKRSVTLPVERQEKEDQWLGDKLVIGPKESALTVDMLRKDGGSMGVYEMPEAKPVDVADLYFTMTQTGKDMLAASDYGLVIKALYGEMLIPAEMLKPVEASGDMNVQLHTDHTATKPAGAQSTSMKITLESGAIGMYVTLPIENSKITDEQLKQLQVQQQSTTGEIKTIPAVLFPYSDTYPHGMRFMVTESGTYTVILPSKS